MSAYNFQQRFARGVAAWLKRSTIRKRRKNGYVPKVGERIRLYTGMRTKRCKLLHEVTVTSVTPILIEETDVLVGRIVLDGRPLAQDAAFDSIIVRDGFSSWPEFVAFFRPLPFAGYLIEW